MMTQKCCRDAAGLSIQSLRPSVPSGVNGAAGDVNVDSTNNGADIVQNLTRLSVLVVMLETAMKKEKRQTYTTSRGRQFNVLVHRKEMVVDNSSKCRSFTSS